MEKALVLIPWRPYRCVDCGARVWRYRGNAKRDLAILAGILSGALMLWAAVHLLSRPDSAEISIAFNGTAGVGINRDQPAVMGEARTKVNPISTLELAGRNSVQSPSPEERTPITVDKAPDVDVAAAVPEAVQAEPEPTRSLTPSTTDLYIERIDAGLGGDNVYTITLEHTGFGVEAKALTLTKPSRLVVDLAGNWPVKKGNPVGQRTYDVGVVQRMRVGRRKGNLRVVVDIQDDRPYEYAIESAGNQVKIRLWAPG